MSHNECRVTAVGIDHLFAPLRGGALCACGRKVALVVNKRWAIQDSPPAGLVSALERLQRRRLEPEGTAPSGDVRAGDATPPDQP